MAGRPPKTTDDEIVTAVLDAGARRVTTGEVAEELPIGREAVRRRLADLADEGRVTRERIGGPGTPNLWSVEERDAGKGRERERDAAETGDADVAVSALDADEGSSWSFGDGLADDLDALDLPGSGDVLDARREAVRACYQFLADHGEATRSGFVDAIYPEHPAGFGSVGGWWNAIGKTGLRGLAERRDELRAPSEGSHRWSFVEDGQI